MKIIDLINIFVFLFQLCFCYNLFCSCTRSLLSAFEIRPFAALFHFIYFITFHIERQQDLLADVCDERIFM